MMISAGAIADAAQASWTYAVRRSRGPSRGMLHSGQSAGRRGDHQRWDRGSLLQLEWLRLNNSERRGSFTFQIGEHPPKMDLDVTSVRSRLADAEPEPEDRHANPATGRETQPRAPHPEEPLGDLYLAAGHTLVRISGAGTVIVVSEPLQKWELQLAEAAISWYTDSWMPMGTTIRTVAVIKKLVPGHKDPQDSRRPRCQILSSRPLPQAVGRQ